MSGFKHKKRYIKNLILLTTVDSHYNGHLRDRHLVAVIERVCNSIQGVMKMAQFFGQYKVPQITSTAILFQGLLQAREFVVDNYMLSATKKRSV